MSEDGTIDGVRYVVLVQGLCACSFHGPSLTADGLPPSDATDAPLIDTALDVPLALDVPILVDATLGDAPSCSDWMPKPKHFDPCLIGEPTMGGLDLAMAGTYTYDTTGAGTLTSPLGAQVAHQRTTASGAIIVDAVSFTVESGATLRVIGDKPLIIASWSAIAIVGTIDAGSHAGASGAGASAATSCTQMPGVSDPSGGGSGGGGGGAFHGKGGNGGQGDNDTPNPGGPGGAAIGVPVVPRAGCPGASSGKAGASAIAPSTSSTVSPGGLGGGAIQLTARSSATVTGRITAGGAGGGGAPAGSACGGGGAGAGGYIGIESPIMTIVGTLAAYGGGGGGSAPFAGTGGPGQDGAASATAAMGGPASSCSDLGPSGSAGATLDGGNADNVVVACGGGGGGGGAGYVLLFGGAITAGSTISPAAQLNPF